MKAQKRISNNYSQLNASELSTCSQNCWFKHACNISLYYDFLAFLLWPNGSLWVKHLNSVEQLTSSQLLGVILLTWQMPHAVHGVKTATKTKKMSQLKRHKRFTSKSTWHISSHSNWINLLFSHQGPSGPSYIPGNASACGRKFFN